MDTIMKFLGDVEIISLGLAIFFGLCSGVFFLGAGAAIKETEYEDQEIPTEQILEKESGFSWGWGSLKIAAICFFIWLILSTIT